MCGIGGVFLTNNQLLSETHSQSLNAMQEFMVNRGPDGKGISIYKNAGMVHTRLSIIDVDSRSNQPMESKHWILSFNGEIVNYRSIRDQLKDKYNFHTESDSEVLLYSLEEWGIENALSKFAGMFSFLAYHKTSGIFYAARDPLGIKPLFYFKDEEAFWFASTPATIKASLPSRIWEIYKPAIASFFVLGAPFTKTSSIDGISQLPPASYIAIHPDGEYQIKKYWSPKYQDNFTMDDLVNVVLEYKNSDVNSALFLSGGIDSTFLGTIIDELDFFHLNSPEKKYAQQVAKKFKRKLIVVNPNQQSYYDGLKKVCHTFGEPLMSCGIPFVVSEAVVNHGYKMAISANGADELFGGYPRTPTDFSVKKFNKHDVNVNKWFDYQMSHIFRNKGHFSVEEYDEDIPSYLELSRDIIKNCTLTDFDSFANYRWIELMTYVLNDLNPTLDAASMANSLEVRVPFLDHRIVQGVLSWPFEKVYSIHLGRKAPLKNYILPIFGRRFIHRPKLGFSIDDKVLANINQNIESNFKTLEESKFIKITDYKSKLMTFDRDMVLLKLSCHVFNVWKNMIVC